MYTTMELPANVQNQFGDATASGDGITFQAGVITGTVNIDRRSAQIPFPKVAYDATFDAANKEHMPSCLPGTRIDVLRQIGKWIDGDSAEGIYWLSGMAGTGKSTISMTIAQIYNQSAEALRKKAVLAGTFFFSRGSGDLASASRFAATIAIQLRELSPELSNLVESAVQASSRRLDSLSIQAQWDALVIRPLSQLSQGVSSNLGRLLLVVDALDECNGEEDVAVLIKCLDMVTRISGVDCRVFLTSRPDRPIRVAFDRSQVTDRRNLVLHDIEKSIVDHDLTLYYEYQLSDIKHTLYPSDDLAWDSTIQSLVEKSYELFIYAATVCRFVRDGALVVADRLTQVVSLKRSDNAEKELDVMYTTVLESCFSSLLTKLDSREIETVRGLFQRIVGTIIVMFDVMTMKSLAMLLGETEIKISMVLGCLHSVIDIPEHDQKPLRILHPSFRDFLLDPNRCVDRSYTIVAENIHGFLLTRCFEILMSKLQRNPLGLSNPGTKSREISPETVDLSIPMAVQYSATYWIGHYKNCESEMCQRAPLRELLQDKYLFWLECLAWSGQLHRGLATMSDLRGIISREQAQPVRPQRGLSSMWKPSSTADKGEENPLHEIVEDNFQFLSSHCSIIAEAPLQVYIPALLFSPSASGVKVRNRNEVPKWIRILNRPSASTPTDWREYPQCISVIHSAGIQSMAISGDSSLIATTSRDRNIRLIDSISGEEKFILQREVNIHSKLAFSPDRKFVVSVDHRCLTIWKIQETPGGIIQLDSRLDILDDKYDSRHTHRNAGDLLCVFTPDGSLLAGCCGIREVWVIDFTLRSHVKFRFETPDRPSAIFFSKNGSTLTASFRDSGSHTPGISWDMQTGHDTGSRLKIVGNPIAFRSDGAYIASTRGRHSFSLVSKEANELPNPIVGDAELQIRSATAAMFRSHTDQPLLAAALYNQIIVYTPETFQHPIVLGGRSQRIDGMIVSPNVKFVVTSGSEDTLDIWNIERFAFKPYRLTTRITRFISQLLENIRNRTGSYLYRSIKYSNERTRNEEEFPRRSIDGSRLATMSQQNHVIISDTMTGKEISRFKLVSSFVETAVSPNFKIFAILRRRGIELWDTETARKGDIVRYEDYEVFTPGRLMLSPKGRYMYFISYSYNRKHPWQIAWEINGTKVVSTFHIPCLLFERPMIRFSPNDMIYAIWYPMSNENPIELRVRVNAKFEFLSRKHIGKIGMIEFAPGNGAVWIYVKGHPQSNLEYCHFIWDIKKDQIRRLPSGRDYIVRMACFSDDGKYLAVSIAYRIDIFDFASSLLHSRLEHDFKVDRMRFSPCGNYLLTNRGRIQLNDNEPTSSWGIFAARSWIQEDGRDLVAIPPTYRDLLQEVNGHTVTFCEPDQGPVFLKLDKDCSTKNF